MKLKSIDTAPKDGRDILLYDKSNDQFVISFFTSMLKYNEILVPCWSYESLGDQKFFDPTHWCELPEVPND